MDGVSSALESVARGPLQRSKRLATRIARAFDNLTDDGGVLDQMSTAIEAIATRATAALQRRQFQPVSRKRSCRRCSPHAQALLKNKLRSRPA
jgi:hypothetical protein